MRKQIEGLKQELAQLEEALLDLEKAAEQIVNNSGKGEPAKETTGQQEKPKEKPIRTKFSNLKKLGNW